MYRSSYTPAERVVFPTEPSPDDVETTASDIQLHDDASDDSEQVQEYDTDSDVSEDLRDDEDALTFRRGIQTIAMRPMKLLTKIMFLCIRTTLKNCK